jgi:hypothetical protein
VNRREGSFTRQRSTISLNAREYLCTPPSRSRVGGAASTLQEDDGSDQARSRRGKGIAPDLMDDRQGLKHMGGSRVDATRKGSLTCEKGQYERTPVIEGHAPVPIRGL